MAVYCITDLHGRYDVWEKMKEFFEPEDEIYCLGDCADRGPDGWRILTEMIQYPKILLLKGNHEDLLYKAGKDYLASEENEAPFNDKSYYQLCYNGGALTFEDWKNDLNKRKYLNLLKNLPLAAQYVNKDGKIILMSHAGYTPYKYNLVPEDSEGLLWDRSHFFDPWDKHLKDFYIIHGHTNIHTVKKYLAEESDINDLHSEKVGAYWYRDGHKCCLDRATFATGIAVILNLDTFEETIIKV